MLNLARLIFGEPEAAPSAKDRLIEAAIEKAIDASDSRLRAVSDYKQKLRDATAVTVDYVLKVVKDVPSPLAMSPRDYGTDPRVRAYFGSADRVKEVFSDARSVREFLARPENKALTHFCAVLEMRLEEKRVLGSQLQGDTVQRDVLKTVLNFGDHSIEFPNGTESALRDELKERIFVGLIEQALLQMASEESSSHELREQRAILKSKLSALRARGLGIQASAQATGGDGPSIDKIEHQIETLEAKLKASTPGGTTLDDHLEQLKYVLEHPDRYARFSQESNRVTLMGYKTDAGSEDDGEEITYTRVALNDTSFVALLVRYPCDELLAPRKLSDHITF